MKKRYYLAHCLLIAGLGLFFMIACNRSEDTSNGQNDSETAKTEEVESAKENIDSLIDLANKEDSLAKINDQKESKEKKEERKKVIKEKQKEEGVPGGEKGKALQRDLNKLIGDALDTKAKRDLARSIKDQFADKKAESISGKLKGAKDVYSASEYVSRLQKATTFDEVFIEDIKMEKGKITTLKIREFKK